MIKNYSEFVEAHGNQLEAWWDFGISTAREEASELEHLEPLANSILEHWDFTVIKDEFDSLDKLFIPAIAEYAY